MSARKGCRGGGHYFDTDEVLRCSDCGDALPAEFQPKPNPQPVPPDLAERIYARLAAEGVVLFDEDRRAIREEIERGR